MLVLDGPAILAGVLSGKPVAVLLRRPTLTLPICGHPREASCGPYVTARQLQTELMAEEIEIADDVSQVTIRTEQGPRRSEEWIAPDSQRGAVTFFRFKEAPSRRVP